MRITNILKFRLYLLLRNKKNRQKKHKKGFKKQERLAKIAAKKKINAKKFKRRRKIKINYKKNHYVNFIFNRSNLFLNVQETYGICRF